MPQAVASAVPGASGREEALERATGEAALVAGMHVPVTALVTATGEAALVAGMHVEARHLASGGKHEVRLTQWYPGTIRTVHADGRCLIDYDDGDTEDSVLAEHIRPLAASPEPLADHHVGSPGSSWTVGQGCDPEGAKAAGSRTARQVAGLEGSLEDHGTEAAVDSDGADDLPISQRKPKRAKLAPAIVAAGEEDGANHEKEEEEEGVEKEEEEGVGVVTHADGLELHLNPGCQTGYKGVRFERGRYRAICRGVSLGCFDTAVEAAVAYARAEEDEGKEDEGEEDEGEEDEGEEDEEEAAEPAAEPSAVERPIAQRKPARRRAGAKEGGLDSFDTPEEPAVAWARHAGPERAAEEAAGSQTGEAKGGAVAVGKMVAPRFKRPRGAAPRGQRWCALSGHWVPEAAVESDGAADLPISPRKPKRAKLAPAIVAAGDNDEEEEEEGLGVVTHADGLELHLNPGCQTGYTGVHFERGRYRAICRGFSLGYFDTTVEAAVAYARKLKALGVGEAEGKGSARGKSRISNGSSEIAEESDEEDRELQGAAPYLGTRRYDVLMALHALSGPRQQQWVEQDAIIDEALDTREHAHFEEFRDSIATILDILGKKSGRTLWLQDGTRYMLTEDGRTVLKQLAEDRATSDRECSASSRREPRAIPLRRHGDGAAPLAEDPVASEAAVTAERMAFNLQIEPSLTEPGASGVTAVRLSSDAAARCAAYLERHWANGKLRLNGKS